MRSLSIAISNLLITFQKMEPKRYLYTGSANLTQASHRNRERGYEMTGNVVSEALADVMHDKRCGKQWFAD